MRQGLQTQKQVEGEVEGLAHAESQWVVGLGCDIKLVLESEAGEVVGGKFLEGEALTEEHDERGKAHSAENREGASQNSLELEKAADKAGEKGANKEGQADEAVAHCVGIEKEAGQAEHDALWDVVG